jgi:hypothetical protein
MVARNLVLAVALAVGASACAACGHAPTVAKSDDDAIISLAWAPEIPDAALWVNGRYIAQLGQLKGGIALSAGTHRIEIRHDDYFPQYVELTVAARERRRLVVELAPILP